MIRISKILNLFGPFLGLAFVYTFLYFYAPEAFHSSLNTKTILTQAVIIAIAALGMTVIIISGGIDLSAGSLIALGTVATALVLRKWGAPPAAGVGLSLLAALAGVLVCTLCGFLNGLIISACRIVPFIVTLGMMQIARGVAKGLAEQTTVNVPPNWLNDLMVIEPRMDVWYSVAPGVWLLLALAVAMFLVLRYTLFGRYVFAIGSNESTARLCGIPVALHRVWIYTLGGLFTGLAAVMQFSNLTLGDSTVAVGAELDIIAAVVIGGGSFSGGEGSILGTIIGALIMAILRNGCVMAGVPNWIQNIMIGSIIIVAVGIDRLKHARQA